MSLEQLKKLYKRIYNKAISDARELAFDIESRYAPSRIEDNSECCKCDKSHAKSDGAAEVVNDLTKLYKKSI